METNPSSSIPQVRLRSRISDILNLKKILSYLFDVYLVKWIFPFLFEVRTTSMYYLEKFGYASNDIAKIIMYFVVLLVMIIKTLLMKIISFDANIYMLTEKLKTGALSTPDVYIAYGEILSSIFLLWYVVVGWDLPIIHKDVSFQNMAAWLTTGIKTWTSFKWAIISVVALWEVYALYQGRGFVLPFEGILNFVKFIINHPMVLVLPR